MIEALKDLYSMVDKGKAKTVAVAAAADQDIMEILKHPMLDGLANFVLVGDTGRIRELLNANKIAPESVILLHATDDSMAAKKVVGMAVNNECNIVMKGKLQTAVFLRAVLNKEAGFRKDGLLSQISVYDKLHGRGVQLLSDCAIAIEPSLEEKVCIIENAIDLAHRLGYEMPRVALLSASELVNPKMPDTVEAAILSKMGQRGQIKGAFIDGPLALDNAVSLEAAKHKNLAGLVAGQADILIAPNLLVGNALSKALVFFAHRQMASALMGAAKPIVMTSRTDTVENKILSILMSLYVSDIQSPSH